LFAPKLLNLPLKTPLLTKSKQEKAVVVVRVGKIVISVVATTGYNDEILSSPDRRYERFLLYLHVRELRTVSYIQYFKFIEMYSEIVARIKNNVKL